MRAAFPVKLLLLATSGGLLSACSLASLPKGYTDIEKQTVNELNSNNYVPRSAKERKAIATQDLFAQTAFWSREYNLNPADLEAAINLASSLRRMGKANKSIEVAQTSRAMYPENVDLMAELAASYISVGKPKKALPIIDQALARRQEMARLWSLKGATLDQLGQFEQARQNYTRALSINPNDPGILANVGLSYALEGDPKTAEIWLRRAASMPGASPTVRQNLALVLGLENKDKEAQQWASQDVDTQTVQASGRYNQTLRGGTMSGGTARPTASQSPYAAPAYGQGQTARPAMRSAPANTVRTQVNPNTNLPPARLSIIKPSEQMAGRPQSSRDILRAMQNQTTAPIPNPTSQAVPRTRPQQTNPDLVLNRLMQKNMPKSVIAQKQQQQLIARARARSQMQAAPQAQAQYRQPVPGPLPGPVPGQQGVQQAYGSRPAPLQQGQPPSGPYPSGPYPSGQVQQMTPQAVPQGYAQNYGQNYGQAYQTPPKARPPARRRRH